MQSLKNNIILIGMPGAGKSTIGVVLAKVLGYHFEDSDLWIQDQEGMLLHEIIKKQGLEGFKKIENRVNASLHVNKSVIATGGSVVYGKEAMMHLKEIGTIIYLQLPLEEIFLRLGDLTKRGVAFEEGQTLEDLYLERVPLYEQYADKIIMCEKKSIREIVEEIGEFYEKTKGN